jgi:hypothetical protein
MIKLPSPEESARLILAIYRHNNVPTGRVLESRALNSQFIDLDGSSADYEAGLRFAAERGWIKIEPNVVRLNAPGFAAT